MKRSPAPEDDPSTDIEFDLVDDDDDDDDDEREIFARDTAIPSLPPEELAAEAMKFLDDEERPLRHVKKSAESLAKLAAQAITIEPPPTSEDLEFEDFGHAMDVFGQALPESDGFGCEAPTGPPAETPAPDAPPKPPGRANRPAFLAETTRNPAAAEVEVPAREEQHGRSSLPTPLDFVDAHESHALSNSPVAGLRAPSREATNPPPVSRREMEEAFALGDYTRALEIGESLLERSPDDAAARRCVQECRDTLTQMLAARIGPLDQVVSVSVSNEELQWLSLDHRSGFLLSLVDGQSTVDEILDISGMRRHDALKIILDLTQQRVVHLS